jgi:hypothetical protein
MTEMDEHWCLPCWSRKTALAKRTWMSEATPWLYRLFHDRDSRETLHLKVYEQPYVRSPTPYY